MKKSRKLEHLKREHYEEIINLKDGADIMGWLNARICREIEATEPGFIEIVDAQGEYDGVGKLPYFGAIATKAVLHFAERRLKAMKQVKI